MRLKKTEQEMGSRAFRDCICSEAEPGTQDGEGWWCPQCSLVMQRNEGTAQLTRQGLTGASMSDQPLFLWKEGCRLGSEELLENIKRTGSAIGIPLRKPSGAQCWGGHTLRISGAVFASMNGAEETEIRDLGGWDSTEQMRE